MVDYMANRKWPDTIEYALSRVTEGSGPVKSGNLPGIHSDASGKVLNPADKPADEGAVVLLTSQPGESPGFFICFFENRHTTGKESFYG